MLAIIITNNESEENLIITLSDRKSATRVLADAKAYLETTWRQWMMICYFLFMRYLCSLSNSQQLTKKAL